MVRIRRLALLGLVAISISAGYAYPWSPRPGDLIIRAKNQAAFDKSMANLKGELGPETYQLLVNAISWISFYENSMYGGTIIEVDGRRVPMDARDLTRQNVNGKNAKQVCDLAARLAASAPQIFDAYRRWVATGGP